MRIDINFASREYILVRKAYLVLAACIFTGVLVFVHSYHSYLCSVETAAKLKSQERLLDVRYAAAEKRLAELKKAVSPEEVKAASRQAAFANEAIRNRAFSWTAFLNRMEGVVPDGVGLTSLKPDFNSHNVDIAGVADSMGQLTEFVDRLTKSQYFEDLPPTFHTSESVVDKDIGKTLQVFNIKIHYNPDGRKDQAPDKAPEKAPEKAEAKSR